MEKTDIYAIALRSEQTAIGLEKEVSASLKQHPSVSENTVFDENMSVKWNREEARLRNELNARRIAGMHEKIRALKESLDRAMKAWLIPKFLLSEKEVNLALRYAKDCTSPLTKEYVDMAERFCAMLNDAHSLAS